MDTGSPRSRRLSQYLSRLGNPYAAEQIFDPADLQRAPDDLQIAGHERGTAENAGRAAAPRTRATATKASFQRGCRDIMRQYIPPAEQGRLRPAHADFIARHENRAGTERHALLTALSRYDLSDLGEYQARFNREREDLTEEKLRELERFLNLKG
jgi:hypothetical protein